MTPAAVEKRRSTPALCAAALLLPPLGLHLAGAPPRAFWIGTGLTLLGFVPGAGYALFRLLASREPVIAGA